MGKNDEVLFVSDWTAGKRATGFHSGLRPAGPVVPAATPWAVGAGAEAAAAAVGVAAAGVAAAEVAGAVAVAVLRLLVAAPGAVLRAAGVVFPLAARLVVVSLAVPSPFRSGLAQLELRHHELF